MAGLICILDGSRDGLIEKAINHIFVGPVPQSSDFESCRGKVPQDCHEGNRIILPLLQGEFDP